jgi:hypothetical protein
MNKYWTPQEVDLGIVKLNRVFELQFKANINLPQIKEIKPGCGCAHYIFSKYERLITVKIKTGTLPKHLKDQQNKTVKIKFTYINDETEEIVIKMLKRK